MGAIGGLCMLLAVGCPQPADRGRLVGLLFATLRRVMFRIVVLCCVLGLGLSGCIAEPQEGGDLPPLAAPSPSVSPSPTGSAAPVDAKTAIAALARAYFLESNQAIRTGSTARLRALTTPNCPCDAFADGIDADWRKGRVDSPAFYTIVDVRAPMLDNANEGHVTVFYRKNRYRVLDRSGKVLVDVPDQPKTVSSSVRVRRTGAGWRVFDVIRLP